MCKYEDNMKTIKKVMKKEKDLQELLMKLYFFFS